MNVIVLLLRSSWRSVAIAVLTGFVSGGCSAQLIALINRSLSNTDNTSETLVWFFVGLAVTALLTGLVSQFLLVDLAQKAVYEMRLRLSSAILAAPLRQLEMLGANQLMATLTEDVASISGSVFVIPFLCVDVAIVVGCLSYLAWLSGLVFGVVVLMLIVAIATVQLIINRIFYYFKLARQEDDRLFKHFRGITEGTKELKLHRQRRQQFFTDELQSSAQRVRHLRTNALKIAAIGTGWGQLLFFFIIGLLLFALPKIVTVTPPVLSSYVLTITYLLVPLQNILERLPGLFAAGVAVQKVEQMGLVLARDAETGASDRSVAPVADWKTLELDGVIHAYHNEAIPDQQEEQQKGQQKGQSDELKNSSMETPDNQFILGPINLTLYPGELVFITGGNGSGKSTLAKLITGLYLPEAGEMRLDGKPITDENLEWYRQHFSVIFADFYLFDRLLGLHHADLDAQAQNYLRQLQLEHKVQIQEGALSTTALSTGQRKRLALLTAYLEDRSIYLFDEWASDQDPVFREVFYRQLLPELRQRGKTVLVVSHDDRYFGLSDRLIKLDYGKIRPDTVA